MDRSKAFAASAVAFSLLGLVEKDTAFAPAIAKQTPSLRAGGLRATLGAQSQAPQQAGAGFGSVAAAAAMACGAMCLGSHRAAKRARPRTQVCADASGLVGGGPICVYTDALMKASAQKDESVMVAKDVMKVKQLMSDRDFLDELQYVLNETGTTELTKAQGMIKLLQPLESTVFEKFVVFLAKKKRLAAVKPICQEFISTMYNNENIAPVVVRSAQRLSEEQIDSLKIKMREKTGCSDVKLIASVDASMVGGFVVEWGFPDPEDLSSPTEGVDLSLSNILRKKALNQGVLING